MMKMRDFPNGARPSRKPRLAAGDGGGTSVRRLGGHRSLAASRLAWPFAHWRSAAGARQDASSSRSDSRRVASRQISPFSPARCRQPADRLCAGDRGDGQRRHERTRRISALARELLLRKCQGKRGNSKLPRLVELCLASPIVSVPFAAKELGVSQQAVTIMIDELSSNLRELTGRGRYRAWAVM